MVSLRDRLVTIGNLGIVVADELKVRRLSDLRATQNVPRHHDEVGVDALYTGLTKPSSSPRMALDRTSSTALRPKGVIMKSVIPIGIVLVAVSVVPGCGFGSERDKVVQEFLAIEKEVTTTAAGISDGDSAEKAMVEMDVQTVKVQDLTARLARLGKPTSEDAAKSARQEREMAEAGQQLVKAEKDLNYRIKRFGIPPETEGRMAGAFGRFTDAAATFRKAFLYP